MNMYQKLSDAYRNVFTFSNSRSNKKIQIILILASAIFLFLLGYLVAYSIHSKSNQKKSVPRDEESFNKIFREYLTTNIYKDNIKSHLKYFFYNFLIYI